MRTDIRFASLLILAWAAMLLPARSDPSQGRLISVSVTAPSLAPGERVVGFHFRVKSGRIAQLPNLPIGWSISVDNDPSWDTKIDASIIVGAAALDTSYFQNFIVVERNESLGISFDMSREIVVSRDFSTVRRIKIEKNEPQFTEK
jgi:hypothetical protein